MNPGAGLPGRAPAHCIVLGEAKALEEAVATVSVAMAGDGDRQVGLAHGAGAKQQQIVRLQQPGSQSDCSHRGWVELPPLAPQAMQWTATGLIQQFSHDRPETSEIRRECWSRGRDRQCALEIDCGGYRQRLGSTIKSSIRGFSLNSAERPPTCGSSHSIPIGSSRTSTPTRWRRRAPLLGGWASENQGEPWGAR